MTEEQKITIALQHDKDLECLFLLRETIEQLRENKPEERGEKARRYAVTITQFEQVLSYFHMYVVNDGAGE